MNEKRRAYQKQYREQYKSRVKRMNLTFTHEEHRSFLRAAKSEGKKTSSYIKELAFSGMQGQAVLPKQIQEELKTLKFAIRNIANNVNQIAHHSNTVHGLTVAEENNLLQHLKQLEEAVQTYTEGQLLKAKEKGHDH